MEMHQLKLEKQKMLKRDMLINIILDLSNTDPEHLEADIASLEKQPRSNLLDEIYVLIYKRCFESHNENLKIIAEECF